MRGVMERERGWARSALLLLCGVVLLAAFLLSPPTTRPAEARGLMERLRGGAKRFGERCREKIVEVAPKVREGARALGRRGREYVERRVRPDLERLREAGRRATDRIRDEVRTRAPRVIESGRRRLEAGLRDYGPKVKDFLQGPARESVSKMLTRLDDSLHRMPEFRRRLVRLGRQAGETVLPRLQRVVEVCGPRIRDAVSNRENWDRAVAGLATAIEIHHRIEVAKDRATRRALDLIGNQVPISVNGRTTTLNEWAGRAMADRFPYLQGTTLAEEPLQALVYSLVAPEPRYIVGELRVLKNGRGEAVSAAEMLSETTGTDTETILGALDVVDKTMSLRKSLVEGGDVLPAAFEFAGAVKSFEGRRR